jgi:hypothetical protein
MNKNWIIALVLLLAVVVIFAACKGNDGDETTTESTTQPTTASVITSEPDEDLELVPGEDLVINDEGFNSDDVLIFGEDSSSQGGEDSLSWEEIKRKSLDK